MRLHHLTTFITILSAVAALPNPSPEEDKLRELLEARYHYLSERWCANPCGSDGQICCGSSQSCITNSLGQPQCSDGGGSPQANAQNGQWQYIVTTYVETDIDYITRTSTYSTFLAAQTTAAAAPAAISGISCNLGLGEKPCGTLCCATGQYCAYSGQCAASDDQGDVSSSVYVIEATATVNTAPLRPTSNAATTVTSTGSATVTVNFQTPSSVSASATSAAGGVVPTESNNGLSGGAIAGIVIGVLVGLFIFFLICAILCCRGIIDAILSFFGLGRRRRETVIEERYSSHHASGGGGGRTWFGRPRPSRIEREKKSSGLGGWTAVTAGLATLAIGLGLKRRRDERREEKMENSSYSSYTYDSASYTSPSK